MEKDAHFISLPAGWRLISMYADGYFEVLPIAGLKAIYHDKEEYWEYRPLSQATGFGDDFFPIVVDDEAPGKGGNTSIVGPGQDLDKAVAALKSMIGPN